MELGLSWIGSETIVCELNKRDEEPWETFNDRTGISKLNLSKYLGMYGIKSRRNSKGELRGYARESFEDAWKRYLPPYTSGEASEASDGELTT
jgi:hypothetical protein